MALSASVGSLVVRFSPSGGGFREAFATSRCSTGILDGGRRNSIGLESGGRLRQRRRRQRGAQDGFMAVRAADMRSGNESGETETTGSEADVEALEARLGVGRRARSKQQQAEGGGPQSKPAAGPAKPKQPVKKWESMNLQEKVWSVYIDPEKGILFWLNKLAYGAIFAIIGGWIVFRFIGPALGWYELDQPLLSPDRLLDGP